MSNISLENISKTIKSAKDLGEGDETTEAINSICEALTNILAIVGAHDKTLKAKTPVKSNSETGKGDPKTAKSQTITKTWNDILREDEKKNTKPFAEVERAWIENNHNDMLPAFDSEKTDLQKNQFFWKKYGKDFANKNSWPPKLEVIKEAFNKNNVILVRADWTKPSKEIDIFLKKYNRFGIPLNAFFSPKYPDGLLLSEILSENQILNSLENIK